VEPSTLVYSVPSPTANKVLARIKSAIALGDDYTTIVEKCQQQRVVRAQRVDENAIELVRPYPDSLVYPHPLVQTKSVIEIGNSDDTHWRYLIWATRTLRTLIRKDAPTSADHVDYFLYAVHDDHPSVVSHCRFEAPAAHAEVVPFSDTTHKGLS
jgi:proteasome activator subunit 4